MELVERFENLLEGIKEHLQNGEIGETHFIQGVEKLNDLADLMSVPFRASTEMRELAESKCDSYGYPIDNEDDSYN